VTLTVLKQRPFTLLAMPFALLAMPFALLAMPFALLAMPFALLAMPFALLAMPFALRRKVRVIIKSWNTILLVFRKRYLMVNYGPANCNPRAVTFQFLT